MTATPLLYDTLEHLYISDSSLGVYSTCERKFEFRKLYRNSGRSSDLPGEVGKALHTGYQSWLVHKNRDRAIYDMMAAYPIELCSDPGNPRSIQACFATLNNMMDSSYFIEYDIATVKCPDGVERPAIEVPFEILIKGFSLSDERHIPVSYIGYIDAILYDKIIDEYSIMDVKTTRFDLKDKTALYHNDPQCLPYGMILERILGHGLHSLTVRYLAVYVDIMRPLTQKYEFEKSKEDIQDWGRTFLCDINEIKAFYNMRWFPKRGKQCVNFKQRCQFFDICNSRNPANIQNWFDIEVGETDERPFEPWFKMELELAA